jgi:hypothetical protein
MSKAPSDNLRSRRNKASMDLSQNRTEPFASCQPLADMF